MTYSEKLKDPRWQKKRLKILERDDWTCQHCGEDIKTLHVHHLLYSNMENPWDTPDIWLVTLCQDCHEYDHAYRKAAEEALSGIFRLNHFSATDIILTTYLLAKILEDRNGEILRQDLQKHFKVKLPKTSKTISKALPDEINPWKK